MIQRNSHLSVYNATIIRRLKINYIYPEISDNSYKIDEKELENILILNKNIKLAVFTSPDYYGRVLNIEKIVEICHKFKVKVLIDEAHGSIDAHSNVRVLCWFSVRNVPHVPRPYCFRVPYVAGGCASNLRKVIASTCFCAEVFSIMKISGSAEDGWVGLSVSGIEDRKSVV